MSRKPLPGWVALGTEVLITSNYRSQGFDRAKVTRMSDTSAWVVDVTGGRERRFVAMRWANMDDRLEEFGNGSTYHSSYAYNAASERGKELVTQYAEVVEQRKLKDLWDRFSRKLGNDGDHREARELLTALDTYATRRGAEHAAAKAEN